MLIHSIGFQAAGLLVATVAAGAFAFALQLAGFFPSTLDITSIELISLRLSPSLVTVAVGLAAGAAGSFGLMTKGPTSLIGVMIAAAIVPAAATVGIAAAWSEYRIVVGSALLLVATMVVINGGAFAVLRRYYRPDRSGWLVPSHSGGARRVLGVLVVVALVVSAAGVGAYQQVTFERTATTEVERTLATEYDDLEPVAITVQYVGLALDSPPTVTVVASRPAEGEPPPTLAAELDRRITEATDRRVRVRVRFREFQRSPADEPGPRVGG